MNVDWSDILWYLALGAFFFMMMRKGGCCGGHRHKTQKQEGSETINIERKKLT